MFFLNKNTLEKISPTPYSAFYDKSTATAVETIESIKENTLGFVKSMELLTNFDNSD